MMKSQTTDLHTLTTAEIARQVSAFQERRLQIVNQRAALYSHSLKNGGGGGDSSPIDADERAARAHAKHLLNGDAPPSLSASESEITLDRQLYREMRGIDIALKILADKSLVARAAEAVGWAEAHADEWRKLAREIMLTAIRQDALERRARELLAGCVDLFAVRLPMGNVIGGRPISEKPIIDLTEIALAEGVITSAEIRKAKNVE
jgi:hypothetical protein